MICYSCDKERPKEQFALNSKRKSGRNAQCKSCKNSYNKRWYLRNKKRHASVVRDYKSQVRQRGRQLLDELKNKACMDCGRFYPPCAMDFDHVRGEKLFEVSQSTALKEETILEEISKCDLVCSNCHRIRTFNRSHNSPP